MGLSNAERRARWRARRDAELEEERKEIDRLRQRIRELEGKKARNSPGPVLVWEANNDTHTAQRDGWKYVIRTRRDGRGRIREHKVEISDPVGVLYGVTASSLKAAEAYAEEHAGLDRGAP